MEYTASYSDLPTNHLHQTTDAQGSLVRSLRQQNHPTNHPNPQLHSKPSARNYPSREVPIPRSFNSNTHVYPVFDSPQLGQDGTIEKIIYPITTSSRHRGPDGYLLHRRLLQRPKEGRRTRVSFPVFRG